MKLKALEGKLKKKKAVANFSQMEQLVQPFQPNRTIWYYKHLKVSQKKRTVSNFNQIEQISTKWSNQIEQCEIKSTLKVS